jgi:hypothetical protein
VIVAVGLCDRQRVDIDAERDGWPRSPLDDGDRAGVPLADLIEDGIVCARISGTLSPLAQCRLVWDVAPGVDRVDRGAEQEVVDLAGFEFLKQAGCRVILTPRRLRMAVQITAEVAVRLGEVGCGHTGRWGVWKINCGDSRGPLL